MSAIFPADTWISLNEGFDGGAGKSATGGGGGGGIIIGGSQLVSRVVGFAK